MRGLPQKALAVSFVGRHNSGKTTLLEKVIAELCRRGVDVGTVKHHGHDSFDIDYEGKDSFRHRSAGAREVVLVSGKRLAVVRELEEEIECSQVIRGMADHDIILVEGFRQSGLDCIEVMRSANERDQEAIREFCTSGSVRGRAPVAVVSDATVVLEAARNRGVPAFSFEDVLPLCDWLQAHYEREKISMVIQAGGESRRMGRSKATVPFLGRPLIMHMVERLLPIADEMLITTNEPENLQFLLEQGYPVRFAKDRINTRGALPGLYTALSEARYPLVAVVACDMVFASPHLLLAEASLATEERASAVVPSNSHGFEPFHAVYRKNVCLPVVEEAVMAGGLRVNSVFKQLNVRLFTQKEIFAAEPYGRCFINVNTPEELQKVEQSILEDLGQQV